MARNLHKKNMRFIFFLLCDLHKKKGPNLQPKKKVHAIYIFFYATYTPKKKYMQSTFKQKCTRPTPKAKMNATNISLFGEGHAAIFSPHLWVHIKSRRYMSRAIGTHQGQWVHIKGHGYRLRHVGASSTGFIATGTPPIWVPRRQGLCNNLANM